MKIIPKRFSAEAKQEAEILALSRQHPYIIRLEEVIEDQVNFKNCKLKLNFAVKFLEYSMLVAFMFSSCAASLSLPNQN